MESSLLIINADDFGYNSQVNRAILASFSQSLCSSTTIMPNMPGFKEASELCHANNLTERVGLHLVFSEGTPLTDPIKKCRRICGTDGQFLSEGRGHLHVLSADEKQAVLEEISAQIDLCRRHGLSLTHIDSHHNVHVEWGIGSCLLRLAEDKRIPYIRLGRHTDPESAWFKNLYRRLFNFRLRMAGYAATKYFGTVEDYILLHQTKRSTVAVDSFEIMIHPVFDREGALIDNFSKEPLGEYISQVVRYKDAVPFSHIKHT